MSSIQDEIAGIQKDAAIAISTAKDLQALEQVRVAFLGRSARLSLIGAQLKTLPNEERPKTGQLLNETRNAFSQAYEQRKRELEAAQDVAALAGLDITLPGTAPEVGAIHPIAQLRDRMIQIFRRMGFTLADGPDVESEWRCFDALNTPADHPARNEKDTFYFENGMLLRTHTSTVQIFSMEREAPPIRIIAPGSAYRRDETDATHSAQFTQMEGLYVDAEVSVADLKGTVEFMVEELFGQKTPTRLRPHFFPFTEPSFEVDVQLRIGDAPPRWIEVAGCGMVDPAVFEAICQARGDRVYDPEQVEGFAFGFGLERLAMILWDIPDIRFFQENDLRFLRQFRS